MIGSDSRQLGSVTPDDLMDALEQVNSDNGVLPDSVSMDILAQSWINQPGYPVVTITRNYTDNTAEISQVLNDSNKSSRQEDCTVISRV